MSDLLSVSKSKLYGPRLVDKVRALLGKHARLCKACRNGPLCDKGANLARRLVELVEPGP